MNYTLPAAAIAGLAAWSGLAAADFDFGCIEETLVDGSTNSFDEMKLVLARDFDNDGDQDLILSYVVYSGSQGLPYLRNNGDGTFDVASYLQVFEPPLNPGSNGPDAIAAADVDGDGDLDVAMADTDRFADDVYRVLLWENTGAGFQPLAATGVASFPTSLAFADFDGDGPDLWVTRSDRLWMRRNNGDGTFGASRGYAFDEVDSHVHFADLDNDGIQEVLTLGSTCPGCQFLGVRSFAELDVDGFPEFQPVTRYELLSDTEPPFGISSATFCTTSDLNGDGWTDVMVKYSSGFNVARLAVFLNNGDGTLGPRSDYSWNSSSSSESDGIDAGDLDGDGDPDLIVSGSYPSQGPHSYNLILENDGAGGLSAPLPLFASPSGDGAKRPDAIAIDIDGDADLDLIRGHRDAIRNRRNRLIHNPLASIDCNENGEVDACDISSGTSEDVNGDGVPDECQCLGDLSGDDVTNSDDLFQLLGSWGPCEGCPEDLNNSGAVDSDDLFILLGGWGPCG